MHATIQPRRRRGGAFSSGIIFAIIAALIIFGFGAITGFSNAANNPAAGIWGVALLAAFFLTPLLAGFVGTLRSGRIGVGTLAGLWDGLFVGIWTAAYVLIAYFMAISKPGVNVDTFLKQVTDQAAQQGVRVTMTGSDLLIVLIVTCVVLAVVFVVIGVVLGVLGAAIGKMFARTPRYY